MGVSAIACSRIVFLSTFVLPTRKTCLLPRGRRGGGEDVCYFRGETAARKRGCVVSIPAGQTAVAPAGQSSIARSPPSHSSVVKSFVTSGRGFESRQVKM